MLAYGTVKNFILKHLPNPETLKKNKSLRFLGKKILDKSLWHLNRQTTSKAVFIGLFSAFTPIPFQMIVSALFAIYLRANIPIAVALVWITNPLTIPFVFYSTYRLGCFLLNISPNGDPFTVSLEWLTATLSFIWLPLYFGSFVFAVFISTIGYFATNYFWRRATKKKWMLRHKK